MKKIFECVGAQSRFLSEADSKSGGWGPCSIEHYEMVLKNPHEHEGYEVRLIFACKEVPGNSFSGLKEQMTIPNQLEASTLTMEKLGERVAELEKELAELTEVEAQRDELLDALIAFRDGGAGKNFDGWHESYRRAIDKARAAIAKATGQEVA